MALPRTQEATAICDSPKGPILRIRDFKAMGAQSIEQANVHKFSIALLCRVPEEHAGASLTVDHVECMCFEALEKLKHSRRGAAVAHGPSWHGGHAVFGLEIYKNAFHRSPTISVSDTTTPLTRPVIQWLVTPGPTVNLTDVEGT